MKISIITATYNSAAHTAGCLESVNNQSLRHTMTQSHGMTDSEQNFRKNNTGQASFEIEHIIVDGVSRGRRSEGGNMNFLRQMMKKTRSAAFTATSFSPTPKT